MTQNDEGDMLAPMWLFDHVAACIRNGDATEEMAQNLECLRAFAHTQAARIAELEALVAADFDMLDSTWKARAEAAEVEVARLREAIRHAHETLYELNPCNYDHDEVCRLNDASVEVILALAPLLGEAHGETPEWWADRAALQPKKEDV